MIKTKRINKVLIFAASLILLASLQSSLLCNSRAAAKEGAKWTVRSKYILEANRKNFALVGLNFRNQVIVWAGLEGDGVYRDEAPWIDVLDSQSNEIKKLVFVESVGSNEVVPVMGELSGDGKKLVFMENWKIGVYDFELGKGFFLKPDIGRRASYTAPRWRGNEIVVRSFAKWGELRSIDAKTSASRVIYAASEMFISNFAAGKKERIVVSLGPVNERIVTARNNDEIFINQMRSDWINLYEVVSDDGKIIRITNGKWYDFGARISDSERYVAFLRGRLLRKSHSERELTLSDTNPSLCVYDFATKAETKISEDPFVDSPYGFAWMDDRTLTFIKKLRKGTSIYAVDISSGVSKEIYGASGDIVSILWHDNGGKLIVIERDDRKNYYLIVLTR